MTIPPLYLMRLLRWEFLLFTYKSKKSRTTRGYISTYAPRHEGLGNCLLKLILCNVYLKWQQLKDTCWFLISKQYITADLEVRLKLLCLKNTWNKIFSKGVIDNIEQNTTNKALKIDNRQHTINTDAPQEPIFSYLEQLRDFVIYNVLYVMHWILVLQ